ncbi:MAG: M48 family metalloprotease, partial [Deltaproteobacteria bacterium]|nr:M48 family metalloprotease [Deltaproteobacteria bacterium]
MKFTCILAASLLLFAFCTPVTRYPVVSKEQTYEEAEKQRELVVKKTVNMISALYNVTYRLNLGNVDLCRNHSYDYGFLSVSLNDISTDFKKTWERLFSVSQRPTVIHVVPGSPAFRAGLKERDVIVEVSGIGEIPSARRLGDYLATRAPKPLKIKAIRDGSYLAFEIYPAKACAIKTQVVFSEQVNAFTDGKGVYITSAIMDFVKDENELALVIGHEMAHCVMDHTTKRKVNVLLGAMLGGVITAVTGINMVDLGSQIGAQVFSQEFEAEADYVGCYLAYRAGFKLEGAEELWRRMATYYPGA